MEESNFVADEEQESQGVARFLKNPLVVILIIVFVLSLSVTIFLLIFPAQRNEIASVVDNTVSTPAQNSTTGSTNSSISSAKATPSITPTPTLDPTINWASFNNSVYGYSINYPKNWTAVNFGSTDPLVVSFFVFNPSGVSASSKSIYIEVSKRTYTQQLSIDGGGGTLITLGGITGKRQPQKDSDGNKSVTIVLPRSKNLLILHAKNNYAAIFNQMLTSLKVTQK